jgi:hypothetical protein
MDHTRFEKEQANKEEILQAIMAGSPMDDQHIARCLDMADNEPDDLTRSYAMLWLQYNIKFLVKRLLDSSRQ